MDAIVKSLRTAFNTNITKNISWRKSQLLALERMLDENQSEICETLRKDLNKADQETISFEIGIIKNAITHTLNHIDEYAKPKPVTPQFQVRLSYSTYVQYQPYGVVLVIGAWNYPYQLCLVPLVGAIGSGNCVLIKPSELSENSAKLMEKLLPKYLDQNCVKVINGGVSETIELLKQRFDYIMYTGNTNIGKSVMEAASKYMTPVTLECGGKSPVYVDSSADLQVAAKRIVWGRFANAGQTCVAPDYVIATQEIQDKLLPLMKDALIEFYGTNAKESDSYGRIVNARHFKRLANLIDDSKVFVGGDRDEATNYISPTIMINVSEDDKVMKEEIFGPILPILTIKNSDEAIDYINRHEKPLALYLFANNEKLYNEFLLRTSSGGFAYNDVMVHCALECLPFGGVGDSGLGNYHGKYSMETFSHQRAVLKGSSFGDALLGFRYPPYNKSKIRQSILATGLFRRNFLTRLFENPIILLAAAILAAFIYKMPS